MKKVRIKMKAVALALLLTLLLTPCSFAVPYSHYKPHCQKSEPIDKVGVYDKDFQLLVGTEINVLPPKMKKSLVGNYMELDQVNLGWYMNSLDPAQFNEHMGAVVFHFNLFKETVEE